MHGAVLSVFQAVFTSFYCLKSFLSIPIRTLLFCALEGMPTFHTRAMRTTYYIL